jgi:hypothetical protein
MSVWELEVGSCGGETREGLRTPLRVWAHNQPAHEAAGKAAANRVWNFFDGHGAVEALYARRRIFMGGFILLCWKGHVYFVFRGMAVKFRREGIHVKAA